jgi:glutamate/tyrosine decarboxylase-like PLP-dependent enzyme
MGFDFDSSKRRDLGNKLIARIDEYFTSLGDRPVQPPAGRRNYGHHLSPLPELGGDAEQILSELWRELDEQGFHIPSGNYFGLVNPAPTYMAVLAEAMVAALNPQLATMVRSELASRIEAETLQWIASRLGWQKRLNGEKIEPTARLCDGTFTSGGNEANHTALALALSWAFPAWLEDGIASLGVRPVLYTSEEAHHSLDKSAGLLGLGRTALRRIRVNEKLQLDVAALRERIESDVAAGFKPFCLIATAGTSSSGAIDDLPALAEIAREYKLWLHVDGAYGAAALFSDQYKHLMDGIERADSMTMDPHKWLNMPFSCGVVLTTHPRLLEEAFSVEAPYIMEAEGSPLKDSYKLGLQWSRRMNSLKLWLTLRVHGRVAYEELIGRQIRQAQELAAWAQGTKFFELCNEPRLPILNLRLKIDGDEAALDAAHQALIDEINNAGRFWISKSTVAGRSVIRMMIISHHTSEANIKAFETALAAAAHKAMAAAVTR